MRRAILALLLMVAVGVSGKSARADGEGQPSDWNRFNYYPYVYYPHNIQTPQHALPKSRRKPVYDIGWYNFYPEKNPLKKPFDPEMKPFNPETPPNLGLVTEIPNPKILRKIPVVPASYRR